MKWRNSNAAASLPTVEIRILLLFCYFTVLGTLIVTTNTIFFINVDQTFSAVAAYVACEAAGASPKCSAAQEDLDALSIPGIWSALFSNLGLFPAVHLLYVVNIGGIMKKCLLCIKRKKKASKSMIQLQSKT